MVVIRKKSGGVSLELEADTLAGARLQKRFLRDADLAGANLRGAALDDANCSGADLSRADLSEADLHGAAFCGADLRDAELTEAFLFGVDLEGADLTGAEMGNTVMIDCRSLPLAHGLSEVRHLGISILDVRTLRACAVHLPDVFLLGVGYTEDELRLLRAMYPS